jgi:hypothetical protein
MAENTKGQQPDKERRGKGKLSEDMTGNVTHQKGSADSGSRSALNEKSSTMGRRDKERGLGSKDSVTGNDYDGQITE